MNADTINAVKEALQPLAQKIGEGAEFIYSVYYRQTIVEGALMLVGSLLLGIALVFFIKFWHKFSMKKYEDDHCSDWDSAAVAVPVILVITYVLAFVWMIPAGAMRIANPHFYTINRIIDSVQDKQIK